ncbi:mitochondrial amidoxime-reducing component 1-like [Phymastichus coffea]|uniref:mitochondrial amidoxime-reducing component 1-like n=1 Tax=Phymastichus coffea TaxID=108790 RepID=UPI00273BE112|nr:mitochondrial amidoxime-reducing component 1-like [Phymastichus coffea]XP_058791539.1 mitochondrial amidoxime-reducing component 1-like [Phymastichus coffea]
MSLKNDGLKIFLMSAGALTLSSLALVWYKRNKKLRDELKLREKVLSSPDTSWKKVANVCRLFCYPLKSGKGKSVKECFFGEYGISIDGGDRYIEDRMFVVFDENTRKFVTGRSHPKLLLVECSFVNLNRARFEADDVRPLEFDLPDYDSLPVPFIMWFGERVNGIDCGSEPARWLSRYLNNTESGLRVALRIPQNRRMITEGAWEPWAKVYPNMRNEDSGLFSDLASYMLLSNESVFDLNQRMSRPIPALQLRPNIVVEGCEVPYAEDDWEWIKIGDQAIIRRFKLCTRCSMTRVDPDTGVPDPSYETLKTLKSYRKIKDNVLDTVEKNAPTIGIYCGLYRPGTVRANDNVYVYQG